MTALCERCGMNAPATNDEWCSDCILEVETILAEEELVDSTPPLTHRPLGHNGLYTLEDLERRVAEYEDEYGLPSDTLLELHQNDRAPIDLPGRDRHVWLSYYREILESRNHD